MFGMGRELERWCFVVARSWDLRPHQYRSFCLYFTYVMAQLAPCGLTVPEQTLDALFFPPLRGPGYFLIMYQNRFIFYVLVKTTTWLICTIHTRSHTLMFMCPHCLVYSWTFTLILPVHYFTSILRASYHSGDKKKRAGVRHFWCP